MDNLIGWIIVSELALILIGMFMAYWRSVWNTESILKNQVVICHQLEALQKMQRELNEQNCQIVSYLNPVAAHFRNIQKAAEKSLSGL